MVVAGVGTLVVGAGTLVVARMSAGAGTPAVGGRMD